MNNRQRKRANIDQNTPTEIDSTKPETHMDPPTITDHESAPSAPGGTFNNKFDYFNNKPSKYYNISYSYFPIHDEVAEGETPKVPQ